MKYRLALAITMLVALSPILASCGGDTSTVTPMPSLTSTPLPPPSPLPPTSTTVPPTSTVGAKPASAADLALIQQALTTTAALKSFHLVQTLSGSIVPQARDVEGDYVAPDKLFAKGRMGDEQGSFLKVGTNNYKQDAQGNWVPWTDPSETKPQTPQEVMGSVFAGLAPIAAISDFQNSGATETLDGVSTQHFVGTIPIGKMPGMPAAIAAMPDLPPAGTIAFWIDPTMKVVHKLEVHLDTGPAMTAATARLATPGAPTPVPAPAAVLTMQMVISRPNDPSIQVPDGPSAGETPTGTSPELATPTGVAGARPATAAEVALITAADTGVADLHSFHYTQVIAGSAFAQPWNIEGDYVAPDQEYFKGQLSGAQGEFLRIGTKSYQKDTKGAWVAWAVLGETTPQTPHDLIRTFFSGLASIAALADFQNSGATETLDGVSTQHFVGTIPIGKMPGVPAAVAAIPDLPPAGTIAFWIDPTTKILHRVEVRLDTGPAMAAASTRLATSSAPTVVPAPAYVFTVDMTVSRPNDPAVQVPAPVAGTPVPASTPTTAVIVAGPVNSGPTPTAVTMPLAASAGHNTLQTALVLPGPAHIDLTLTSPQDVVYFSFRTGEPASASLWFYSPQDSEGVLKVQLLDASEKELNSDTLKPDYQASLSSALPTPGVYYIKVTASGLTKISKTPVQVELQSLDLLTP
jgi:hypothetical protein